MNNPLASTHHISNLPIVKVILSLSLCRQTRLIACLATPKLKELSLVAVTSLKCLFTALLIHLLQKSWKISMSLVATATPLCYLGLVLMYTMTLLTAMATSVFQVASAYLKFVKQFVKQI